MIEINGNRWHEEWLAARGITAEQAAATMTDCTDCTDCTGCMDCTWCRWCTGCTDK